MTYSPEELLDYAKDQNLLLDLMTATHNNDIGFMHLITTAAIRRDPDGTPIVSCNLISEDGKPEDFPLEDSPDLDTIIEAASRKKNMLLCAIVAHNDEFDMMLEVGDDEADLEAQLNDKVLLAFIEAAGINTRGRLKAAIRRGQEILDAYMRYPENIMDLTSDTVIKQQRQIDRILETNDQHYDI